MNTVGHVGNALFYQKKFYQRNFPKVLQKVMHYIHNETY